MKTENKIMIAGGVFAALVLLGAALPDKRPPVEPAAAVAAAPVAAPAPSPAPEVEPTELAAADREQLPELLDAAKRGDYQAQRNVAYLLGKGSRDERVQACAWRGIIVAAGHKEADASDVRNVAAACDRLSEVERQSARTWAVMLMQQPT